METRLLKLEWLVEMHKEEIQVLSTRQREMSTTLESILKILTKIQYAVYGGGVIFISQEIGVTEVIKKFVGL